MRGVEWQEHGLVFPSEVGTPMIPRNLLRHFKGALKQAGLPDSIRFHSRAGTCRSVARMKDDRLYLDHIIEHLRRILAYTHDRREVFLSSLLVQDAVIRNFEIIGEAAKRISEERRAAAPEIPWRRIAGFRDVLILNYASVNLTLVWNVIASDLQALLPQIERVRESLDQADPG